MSATPAATPVLLFLLVLWGSSILSRHVDGSNDGLDLYCSVDGSDCEEVKRLFLMNSAAGRRTSSPDSPTNKIMSDDTAYIIMIIDTLPYGTFNQHTVRHLAPGWLDQRLDRDIPFSEIAPYCTSGSDCLMAVTLEVIKDILVSAYTEARVEFNVLLDWDFEYHRNESETKSDHSDRYISLISDIADLANASNHSFHIFVHPNITDGAVLGVAGQCTVGYNDSSHLNKALTLRNLINKGQMDNLQAHLLSKGVLITVHDYSTFNEFPFPSFDETFGYRYKDMCASVQCSESDSFCSPLHGCVEKGRDYIKRNEHTSAKLSEDQFTLGHSSAPSLADSNYLIPSVLSITQSVPKKNSMGLTLRFGIVKGTVEVQNWKVDQPFIEDLIHNERPVLLKGTVVNSWAALGADKWTIDRVCDKLNSDILTNVKCSNTFLTFDPDHKTPLKLNLSIPYDIRNMSKHDFCTCVQNNTGCDYKGYYYFKEVPSELRNDLIPNEFLFNTDKDKQASKQFLWISSEGMITHGHFDQDYNIFVQIEGKKRFTLWSPWQHELMYMYPRVHPMWHKSRINFGQLDLVNFPQFGLSKAQEVVVGPGDILYVPPYTWHYVETLSPSISLSSWSHDYHMYDHMNAIYGYDHKFDLMQNQTGQMFALRMYLDLLIQDLYGYRETGKFFSKLLHTRFDGLEDLFPPHKLDTSLCDTSLIPTAQHVYGFVQLDVAIVAPHFRALKPEVMDILLGDYVEEITAQVVGIDQMLAFYRYCFQNQDYYTTDINQPEHTLWD